LERHRAARRWVRGTAAVAALVGLVAAASTTAGTASVETSSVSPNSDAGPITFSMSVDPGDPVPIELITDEAAEELYEDGYRGKGIDVALVDTGVTPVNGLNQPGKIIYGPDLSNESAFDNLANLDTYGHGTHMAGIIVGDDNELVKGVAPDSRLVSVKVAGATGETDVAQVIAGIDWVVEHQHDNGLDIRVLNLSFGAEGVKDSKGDLLSAAVERAWDAGIIVVAAVGNRGNNSDGIDTPAISPYVIAVGGTESYDSSGEKDYMGTWSSSGNEHRTPDVAAPGRSILSFRVPGSMLDQMHPEAVVKENYFKGTGTSQSVAVVSGFIAALLSANPSLTPDQVKFLFEVFADDIAKGEYLDGSGKVDLEEVSENTQYWQKAPVQAFDYAIPTKRDDGTVGPSTANTWSGGQWNGASWSGGTWSGASWSGASWSGASWSGGVWSGASWSGASWSGASWSGASWSGASWSGASWSGASWSGASWSGASWSGASWSGASWSGLNWSAATWDEFSS
jgi:serine protease AprX